jgi:acyl-homoserine lactone acylase PvdQ
VKGSSTVFLAVMSILTLAVPGCGRVREMFAGTTTPSTVSLPSSVTIMRDERGVAHVYGPTDASVAFGAAFAQAEDDYSAIEDATVRAIGRSANLYGEAELANDLVRIAFDVERRARAEYAAEPMARRVVWDAFAAGLNHYVSTSNVQRRLIGTWEPWMMLARFQHIAGIEASDDSSGLVVLRVTGVTDADTVSSIAWAIAPERSATRAPLLLFSSFGPFEGGERPYEIHVESAEGWSFSGAVRIGTPVPYASFNTRTAWAITAQHFPVETTPVAAADITERLDTVRINTANGVQTRTLRFRRSASGPVVIQGGATVTAKWQQEGGMQLQYALSRSTSFAQLDTLRMPALDVIYADADGVVALFGSSKTITKPEAGWVTIGNVATSPAQDTSWTTEELAAAAFDTRLAGADSAIDALVLEWEQIGGTNPARAMKLDASLDTMRVWNRTVSVQSKGTSLFVLWQTRLAGVTGAFARLRALEDVLAVNTTGVRPWGEINRLRRTGARDALALNSLPRVLRGMTRFDPQERATGFWNGATGNAWILVVQAGSPESARTVLPNGQSGDSTSVHYFDQALSYARGELRPAWFSRDSVMAHAVRSYHPGERDTVR